MNKSFFSFSISLVTFQALIAASLSVSILALSFFVLEPQISHGDQSVDFNIRQEITDETSFLVPPANVTMTGPINGLTGGNATGSTQFVVRSNNPGGYTVEIEFEDNAGNHAMRGDSSGGEEIRDYSGMVGGTVPSFNFVASTAAQFAYSAYSSTTADTPVPFRNDGSACNVGSNVTFGTCWRTPNTGSTVLVASRTSPAPTGATSTLLFRVNVPSGASPAPTAQTYTATATLSVTAI